MINTSELFKDRFFQQGWMQRTEVTINEVITSTETVILKAGRWLSGPTSSSGGLVLVLPSIPILAKEKEYVVRNKLHRHGRDE